MSFTGTLSSLNEKSSVRISTIVLTLYIMFLPVSTALSGFITSVSIQSLVAVTFIGISALEILFSKELDFNRNLTPVYVYFLFMLMTLLWNRFFALDWYVLQYSVTFLIIICVSVRKYSDAELKFIKIGLYCSIIVAIISSLFFSFFNGGRMYILISSLMDPNDFACGLAIAFALCITGLLKGKQIVPNGIFLVTILGIVYFTGSRGGLLTMLCIIFVWVLSLKGRVKYMILLAMCAAVALLLFCAEYGIGPSMLSRFSISALLSNGGTGRLDIWKAAMRYYVSQDPFHMILGNGLGSFAESVRYVAIGNDYQYVSHNMFVNTLIEGGIVGLSLLISCFVTLYIHAIKNKNLLGVLAVTGFIVSGLSLDVQSYRTFAIAAAMALIWRKNDCDILNRGFELRAKEHLENESIQHN